MGILPKKSATTNAGYAESRTEPSDSDLMRLSILELREVAKRRGISPARSKAELLHYIQDKDTDVDRASLKGYSLFARCRELHISRLRSKADLVRLLQI